MALCSTIVQQQSALIAQQEVLESLTTWLLKHDCHNSSYDCNSNNPNCNLPRWVHNKPHDPNEMRDFNNCTWYYCSKCHKGAGSWNITHTTGGHITNYYHQWSPTMHNNNHSSGFWCMFLMDSQDSDHSCKRLSVTFKDQCKPASFKYQAQTQQDPMSCSQMLNSLKGTWVSLLHL